MVLSNLVTIETKTPEPIRTGVDGISEICADGG